MTTSEDNTTEKDPMGDWFRKVGTAMSDEDYEQGITLLASRDPEVAVLRERVAELEAVAEKVRLARAGHPICYVHTDADVVKCGWKRAVADIDAALDIPPSEVLAAVRREAAAEGAASALEDVAHEWSDKTWLRVLTQSLVTCAAEIRAGGNQ